MFPSFLGNNDLHFKRPKNNESNGLTSRDCTSGPAYVLVSYSFTPEDKTVKIRIIQTKNYQPKNLYILEHTTACPAALSNSSVLISGPLGDPTS